MQAQIDHVNNPSPLTTRALTWGVIWRVPVFLAASGAVLGVILGILYFSFVAFRGPNGETSMQGLYFAVIVGAFVGVQVGISSGLILGLIEGLVLGAITYYILRRGWLPALYPRQFLIAALVSSIAVDLLILLPYFALANRNGTTPAYGVTSSIPYIIAALTVVTVAAGVARWAIKHTRTATPS